MSADEFEELDNPLVVSDPHVARGLPEGSQVRIGGKRGSVYYREGDVGVDWINGKSQDMFDIFELGARKMIVKTLPKTFLEQAKNYHRMN